MLSENEGLRGRSGTRYFRVTVSNQHVSASIKVYAFDPFDYSLKKFFAELAENWKGFEGEKVWTSLEAEFAIACTSDKLGHFAIECTIRNYLDKWCARNTIYIEAGQLEKIASDVKSFFEVSNSDL